MLGKFLVALGLAAVALILMGGLYTVWMGGETSRNWSNWLMRMRVLAQFITVLIILAVLYFTAH
jgi:uncharacterized membrane protein